MVVTADTQQGIVSAKMSFMEATTKVGSVQYAQYLIRQLAPAWGKPETRREGDATVLRWTCVPSLASRLKAAIQDLQTTR